MMKPLIVDAVMKVKFPVEWESAKRVMPGGLTRFWMDKVKGQERLLGGYGDWPDAWMWVNGKWEKLLVSRPFDGE